MPNSLLTEKMTLFLSFNSFKKLDIGLCDLNVFPIVFVSAFIDYISYHDGLVQR